MFTNNRRYIAENETREDYIRLDLKLSSPTDVWGSAIEIMIERLEGRYLEPMRTLIHTDVNKNGFAAMALCCLLIETLLQFREGYPQTPDGRNKQCYSTFLKNQLGHVFDTNMANRFYKDIRCGILHSGQTKNGSCLTFDANYIVRIQGNDIMMVNVEGMYYAVEQYFQRYCSELIDPDNIVLRRNFINKMDDITKKWEGDEIIDTLWFAICEKEKREIVQANGNPFSFEVISNDADRQALKILNGRQGGIRIFKEEIEDALYYWPNEIAIQKLDNGNYILPILNLCRESADKIIQRHIA